MKNYEPKVNISINDNKENEKQKNEENKEKALKVNQTENNYLGIIDIPKIHLKRYLYKVNSSQNNVNKNIEVLKSSDMPNVKGGNLILAAHNGNSSVGHFRNLHQLSLGDQVIISYENLNYTYEISKIYDVLKTGKVAIKRDKNKTSITLITCLGSDRQLVVIGYLK